MVAALFYYILMSNALLTFKFLSVMADERGLQNPDRLNQNNDTSGMNENELQEPTVNESSLIPERMQRSGTANRGFAAMDPERQKRIASEGGRAAHRQGVAHEWSKDEAREAGRKGGQMVSQNREHMSAIGRKGGQSSGSKRAQNNEGRP